MFGRGQWLSSCDPCASSLLTFRCLSFGPPSLASAGKIQWKHKNCFSSSTAPLFDCVGKDGDWYQEKFGAILPRLLIGRIVHQLHLYHVHAVVVGLEDLTRELQIQKLNNWKAYPCQPWTNPLQEPSNPSKNQQLSLPLVSSLDGRADVHCCSLQSCSRRPQSEGENQITRNIWFFLTECGGTSLTISAMGTSVPATPSSSPMCNYRRRTNNSMLPCA